MMKFPRGIRFSDGIRTPLLGAPAVVAALMAAYYFIYGPKKLAAAAVVATLAAASAYVLLRRRPASLPVVSGLLLVVVAAIPFSESQIERLIRIVRRPASIEIPRVPQASSVAWSTQFATPPAPGSIGPNDWPGWRGPNHDGIAAEAEPPITWSATSGVVWRSEVPGRGHSSPCLVSDRVLLATADEEHFAQGLVCYDAENGKQLWASRLHQGSPVSIHTKNSYASPTPCSDGRLIYATFYGEHDDRSGIWASAVDLSGHLRWQTYLGPLKNNEGYAPSPICDGDYLYVAADGEDAAYVAAIRCESGTIQWKVERANGTSYGGPVVADVAGRRQLLLTGNGNLISYDPADGRELWRCGSLPQYCAGTPAWDDQTVYATGGSPDRVLIAVRADGAGDVTNTHLKWRITTSAPYVPSVLSIENELCLAGDQGVLSFISKSDGKTRKRVRLAGNFSASPTLAGDSIFVPSEEGVVYVLSPDGKVIAENELSPGGMATPAFVKGRVYLRTYHFLYCLTKPPQP